MENKAEGRALRAECKNRGLDMFHIFCFMLCALCSMLLAVQTSAQEKKTARESTVITANMLTADNKARTALFEGSVAAKKGDMTMYADKMLVFYAEEKGSSNIKKIEAEGNVKVIKGERVVTSRFAVYHSGPEEHIVFTGEPRAAEGENVVTGTKMVNYIRDDRSVVENSKVFLVERTGGSDEAGKKKLP